MQLAVLIERMERTPATLDALLDGLTEEDARRRSQTGAWSIVEIVNHLADEEVEDFRTRVRMTLEDPSRAWPGIDPEGVAIERRYNERDLGETLQRFASERSESIVWLRSLKDPDWDRTYHHRSIGELRAGDVMVSWAAHDQLHLRQIAKRLFELAQRDGSGYSVAYAGSW